ncbi:MAG: hypothetical protein ACYDER_24235 [Ktedonobacteraceae bacterium]
MTEQFKNLTKALAHDTLSRREVMRTMAGAIAGMTLASWFPGTALAQSEHTHTCKNPGTCSNSFPNCELKRYHNTNCYCFQQINSTRGVCCCNTYCSCDASDASGILPCGCLSQSNCPSGYFCISNTGCGCTSGLCLQKCNSTCTLSGKQSGRTAAGV